MPLIVDCFRRHQWALVALVVFFVGAQFVSAGGVNAPVKWWQWQRWRVPNGYSRIGPYRKPVPKPPNTEPPRISNSVSERKYYPFYCPPKPPPCRCGVSNAVGLRGRIVGGHETDVMAYPWITHLTDDEGIFICGATLITDRHLITAAHCLRRVEPNKLWATIGDHDRSRPDETPSVTVRVQGALVHPYYDRASFDNDIAVVKLCHPVRSRFIRPVCLPPPGPDLVGRRVVVAGWGKTNDRALQTEKLHEVEVKIVSRDVCLRMPLEPYENLILTSSMLCAGVPEGGKDACQGDSGGPLMWEVGGRWVIVGIVSKGYGCAEPNRYGIYTRVDRFLEWLLFVTEGAVRCR